MKEERLLNVFGMVDDKYIVNAAPESLLKKREKKLHAARKRRKYQIKILRFAAVLIIALMSGWFFQIPAGAAVVERVQEQVTRMIEILFPPKEITITPEGLTEEVAHSAQGKEPEADTPGFAIYVDTEQYTMTEEEGIFYIRPIEATDSLLPAIEMVIIELPDVLPETAAEEAREQMEGDWETITEILRSTEPPRLYYEAYAGSSWDSAIEEHYFYKNGQQGTYHIILRYFMEATEGAGMRFRAMLNTFTVIAPQDTIDLPE